MQTLRFVSLVPLFVLVQHLAFAQTSQTPQPDAGRYPLIPWPGSLTPAAGEVTIDVHTPVLVEAAPGLYTNEVKYLQKTLRQYLGPQAAQPSASQAKITSAEEARLTSKTAATLIIIKDDPNLTAPESYRLSIKDKTIELSAHSPAGLFYAIQTLRQLLPAALENGHGEKLKAPCVRIEDHPAYSWRGMMLDVSRHFFGVDYLKKFIDMMALYKYNMLHLHLTDDQGWRIEIKKYPRLTRVSGWRTFNDQDSACMKLAKQLDNPDFELDPAHLRSENGKTRYGGYYTQEEMKAIIRYAAERHIEIVPEIDMPGHMMAAIVLHPELSCSGGQPSDWRHGFSTPMCPVKENTLEFAKDIFTEIARLSPSKYIHIGGDEVDMTSWQNSPLCRQFMQEHHFSGLNQLQSWFNDYMEAFFRSKGKILVGWDEIVAGGIDSNAAVMYWRTWAKQAPLQATRNGNKVIMTADGPLYFDAWPDRNSLSAVYHYNPVDPAYGMDAAEQQNVIGVQGNLWTERVPTAARADYLVMPRMTALAELGWTHQDLYEFYLQRLNHQYDRLDRLHIRYRLPDLTELSEHRVFIDTASFYMTPPTPKFTIHYTDKGYPTINSPILDHPLPIDRSREIRVAAFTAAGRRGDVQTIFFDRQSYAPATDGDGMTPGLQVDLFHGEFQHTADMSGKADSSYVAADVVIPPMHPDAYGLQFRGFIEVPATGIYSFFLTSDDGSTLKIAGRAVVDNDGAHSSQERSGQVALSKGLQPIVLDYMDLGGGGALELRYSTGNGKPQPVPASWFKH
jgi:hexosaminidase